MLVYLLMVVALLLTACAIYFGVYTLYEPVQDKLRVSTTQYVEWMREQLDSMFIEISPRRCVYFIAGSTIVFALLPLILLGGKEWTPGWTFLRLVLVVAATWFGWTVPRRVVNLLWSRRVARFDEQMLDALTLMSNALKAGLSFIQAMDTVVREMPNPISQEFGLVLRQQQLGAGVNDSLRNLEQRMGSEDVRIVVTAVMILRDTGGNLSETFDTMAYTIRERKKVKGKIEALTAQGVMQGFIIFCMPFALGVILYVMDPILIARMWQTALGIIMLCFMLVLQIIGGLLMKKIVTIQV